MKIGIIYCCYGNPEYINDCLAPWIEAKKSHDILIAAVHGQFKEYHDLGIEDNDIKSALSLVFNQREKKIDFTYIQNAYWEYTEEYHTYQSEAEIRDKGLQWLLKQNCDIIWLLDNDERYTIEEINNIIEYINRGENSFESWFSIPMKNYILDGKQWISGFCPPRIFRVNPMGDLIYKLDSFYWDNDIQYKDPNGLVRNYKQFSHKKIPDNLLNGGICHLTWLHSNGKNKVAYQLAHFGHSSYKWNEEKQELEIDYDFYRKIGQNPPIIYHD